jgi:chemotaxis protein CheD
MNLPIDDDNLVLVGLAEMVVSGDGETELVAQSIGSCLGIAIHDPVARVGGLLHVMLPDSSIHPAKAQECPHMFVDTGLPMLFHAAYDLAAEKSRIVVKVAGGADLLGFGSFSTGIGRRNYEAAESILNRNGVAIASRETGGNISRTVRFNVSTGRMIVRSPGCPDLEM